MPSTTVSRFQYAPINGIRLAYTRSGAGTPLLCFHGGLGIDSASLRMPGILDLADRGCDLVIFDQRGHGRSGTAPDSSYTHAVWASDAAALAAHLDWTQYALLGHSYGGFIVLEHAVRWPSRLTHLVLVATSAGPVPFEPVSFNSPQQLRDFFRERWPFFFAGEEKHWSLFDTLHFSPGPFNAAFTRELPRYDLHNQIGRLDIPTLLIVGSRDPYLSAMRWLAEQLPEAALHVLDGVGHFPFIEAAEEFRSIVAAFLGGHSGSVAAQQ